MLTSAKLDLLLYEGVLSAIWDYHIVLKKKKEEKKGLAVEENFVGGDSGVWKCIVKGNVKYLSLLQMGDVPKCVDRWSKRWML